MVLTRVLDGSVLWTSGIGTCSAAATLAVQTDGNVVIYAGNMGVCFPTNTVGGSGSYLKMQNRTREQVIDDAKPDAEKTLKREAVLAAVAEQEKIEVSDEELLEALEPAAEAEEVEPADVLERLRSSGRDALLREDLRLRKAVDVIASAAKPIPIERAAAREKLWTPEKEKEEKGELWTPESD
jgi:hypothetical protein